MFLCDLHIHSEFSPDACCTVTDMCDYAVSAGLQTVAFTEHWDVTEEGGGQPFYDKKDGKIKKVIADTKEKYTGRLDVLYGIELGQPHHNPREASDFIKRHSFDFVLGSVHSLLGGVDIYYINYQNREDVRRVLSSYLNEICDMADTGLIHSIAHLEYPMRVMNRALTEPSLSEYRERIDEILKKAVASHIAIEVNTKGLSSWYKRLFPRGVDSRALPGTRR